MKWFISLLFYFSIHLNAGDFYVSVSDASVTEGGDLEFVLVFDYSPNKDGSVDYTIVGSTATYGEDYNISSGTYSWIDSGQAKIITIPTIDDTVTEGDETLRIFLSNPQGAKLNKILDGEAVGTILNDDTSEAPPVLYTIPNQYAMKDINYSLDFSDYVVETNGDTVSYTLINLDDNSTFNNTNGLTFDSTSGVLSGVPTILTDSNTLEPYNLKITASDNDGNVSKEFTLNVEYGFCYQYAYQQNNEYFTENNTDNSTPYIRGSNIDTDNVLNPVEITLYLKYISNMEITDLNMTISDINTTQASYTIGSTTITTPGSLIYKSATVGNETSSAITDVDIPTPLFKDYFYIRYDLVPHTSNLNMPITGRLDFTIINNSSHYTKSIGGSQIPLCSYIADNSYTTTDSIFNTVHNDYYNASTTYYNLPTQIVNRPGNFKVISLHKGTNNLLELNATAAFVEMINSGKYGNPEYSCQQPDSAITPSVGIIFRNSSSEPFDAAAITAALAAGEVKAINAPMISSAADFYKTANKNTAFRVTRFFDADDQDLIQLEVLGSPEKYNVLNFPNIVKLGECAVDMDENPNSTDMVAQWCSNAGASYSSAMTTSALFDCFRCVYGYQLVYDCSKDNFAIRPEAFKLKYDDQNQTNPASQSTLASPINAAAGYNYNLEVTATTHTDDNASEGYGHYGAAKNDIVTYKWNSATVASCNTDDNPVTVLFTDGYADGNTSVNEVGEYKLQAIDSEWSAVDWNQTLMLHHDDATYTGYFRPSNVTDCIVDSNATQAVNYTTGSAAPFTGCNISSSHTNTALGTTYNDINITFHPYKFNVNDINASTGLNNNPINANSYVYMADMNSDEQMSYHLNGFIRAQGYSGLTLSNFVSGCYAKPIDINITKTMDNPAGTLAYQYRFKDLNVSGGVVSTSNGDLNNTAGPIGLSEGNFTTGLNGSINSNLHLNFKRVKNVVSNPREIRFIRYDVDCTNASTDCNFSADLTTKTTHGEKNLDHNVTHYYGRTHATRQIYEGFQGTANIYYESFCHGKDDFNITCNKSLISNHNSTLDRSDDIRWFMNKDHNSSYGNAGTVNEKGSPDKVAVAGSTTGNHPDNSTLMTYDQSVGYPYKTTMENNASNWLIQSDSDASATRNYFPVEFVNVGDWSGEHNTSTTTNTPAVSKTNRRIMW